VKHVSRARIRIKLKGKKYQFYPKSSVKNKPNKTVSYRIM